MSIEAGYWGRTWTGLQTRTMPASNQVGGAISGGSPSTSGDRSLVAWKPKKKEYGMSYPWRALLFFFIGLSSVAQAATQDQIDTARNKALAWLLTNQTGEGKWSNATGSAVISTATAIDSIAQFGIRGYPSTKAISWLSNAEALSTDALARQIISLSKAGMNTSLLTTRLLSSANTSGYSWGSYDHYAGSFPDTPLTLDAIYFSNAVYGNAVNSLAFITGGQTAADGGWPYVQSEPSVAKSQIVPTAHNVLTLIRFKPLPFLSAYSATYQTSIANGITWLKSKQVSGGGFGTGTAPTNTETAMAYLAIVAAAGAADPAAVAARDYLLSTQQPDGSWGEDPFTTALVLETFPAVNLADADKDGIPDAVETLMGTNPSVADSRSLAKGNGESIPGATTALFLGQATIGQPFSMNLALPLGATAPYTWKLVTGTLPPGIGPISPTTGLVSGIPTQTGSYSFTYLFTDSSTVPVSVTGTAQIDVVNSIQALSRDGDLNGDGVVDVADVALAERFALGLVAPTPEQLYRGDVAPAAGDSIIDAADVACVTRKALDLACF